MRNWAWIAFLTILWLALTNQFYVANWVFALLVALLVIFTSQHWQQVRRVRVRAWFIPLFILFMIKEMVMANLKVIADVLTPGHNSHPGVVSLQLSCQKDYQKAWVANMISLTPGTLTLEVDDETNTLFIHVMFLKNEPAVLADIRRIETQVLRMLP